MNVRLWLMLFTVPLPASAHAGGSWACWLDCDGEAAFGWGASPQEAQSDLTCEHSLEVSEPACDELVGEGNSLVDIYFCVARCGNGSWALGIAPTWDWAYQDLSCDGRGGIAGPIQCDVY